MAWFVCFQYSKLHLRRLNFRGKNTSGNKVINDAHIKYTQYARYIIKYKSCVIAHLYKLIKQIKSIPTECNLMHAIQLTEILH